MTADLLALGTEDLMPEATKKSELLYRDFSPLFNTALGDELDLNRTCTTSNLSQVFSDAPSEKSQDGATILSAQPAHNFSTNSSPENQEVQRNSFLVHTSETRKPPEVETSQ